MCLAMHDLPAVDVGKAHDVVLAQIGAGLDFNKHQRDDAGVLQPVPCPDRNIC